MHTKHVAFTDRSHVLHMLQKACSYSYDASTNVVRQHPLMKMFKRHFSRRDSFENCRTLRNGTACLANLEDHAGRMHVDPLHVTRVSFLVGPSRGDVKPPPPPSPHMQKFQKRKECFDKVLRTLQPVYLLQEVGHC